MRVSQLLKVMDKTDFVSVFDNDKPITNNRLYQGEVRDIKKDNPINRYHIIKVFAYDDVVIMEVVEPKRKGATDENN